MSINPSLAMYSGFSPSYAQPQLQGLPPAISSLIQQAGPQYGSPYGIGGSTPYANNMIGILPGYQQPQYPGAQLPSYPQMPQYPGSYPQLPQYPTMPNYPTGQLPSYPQRPQYPGSYPSAPRCGNGGGYPTIPNYPTPYPTSPGYPGTGYPQSPYGQQQPGQVQQLLLSLLSMLGVPSAY